MEKTIEEIKSLIMEKTIKELEELVSTFEHRKLFTNDSIIMVGDLERLKNLIMKLKLWKH